MEIIEKFICVYNTYNLYVDSNLNKNHDDIQKLLLLTENEQEIFIKCINEHLIASNNNFDQFCYEFLEKYLDSIKKYIKTFEINNEHINFIIFELMKNKMKYKFNEESFDELFTNKLFNSDKETNDKNENNIEKVFFEFINMWINNDPNNFYDLVKYSKKNNKNSYLKFIMEKFIQHNELKIRSQEIITTNIEIDKMIKAFEIILNPNDFTKVNIADYDTIEISKLLHIMTVMIMQKNTQFSYKCIEQTIYVFDKYISDYINYDDEIHNLFIHNVYYNYSKIIKSVMNNHNIQQNEELIDFVLFEKIHTEFKQILKILFDFVGYNQILMVKTQITQQQNENKNNDFDNSVSTDDSTSNSDNVEDSNNNTDDENDISNNNSTDNDSYNDMNELNTNKQINLIFEFIKKEIKNRKYNQSILKNISEIYWNKTKDFNKSIKSFKYDLDNKKFIELYNKTKNNSM